ncbi:hypothetical protein H1V43_00275 [Streptomyces sp. PSKA54]|uniref:Nucleopolyhedrovirus P10 family protein n=1 Tax=Streptomyces himalayensis subsp. aureolus TaxID=2758039 RepID=A0A7W2CVI2_9ACTN|nr:hypothetical protein [Streptomyces himalayensis subsp. aureolus]
MTADRWTQAVRRQLGLGRLLPLGGPRDGAWLAESAADSVLRTAADEQPGIRLGVLRIAPADPDAGQTPAVPPPPSALPPGPLRITAEFAATPTDPLPTTADRLRGTLFTTATEAIGLTVTDVDLRVTTLLDAEPSAPEPSGPEPSAAEPSAAESSAAESSASEARGGEGVAPPADGRAGEDAGAGPEQPGDARFPAGPGHAGAGEATGAGPEQPGQTRSPGAPGHAGEGPEGAADAQAEGNPAGGERAAESGPPSGAAEGQATESRPPSGAAEGQATESRPPSGAAEGQATESRQPSGAAEGQAAEAAETSDAGGDEAQVAAAVLAVPGVVRLTGTLGGRGRAVHIDEHPRATSGAALPRRHVRVELAASRDHRTLDVAVAVRAAVSEALPNHPTVAVLVTELT